MKRNHRQVLTLTLILAAWLSPAPVRAQGHGRNAQRSGAQSSETASMEAAVVRGINGKRGARRLAPLQVNDRLSALARDYSRRMAERGFFDHTDPDGRTFDQRMHASGIRYRSAGENLYTCEGVSDPVRRGVEGWMRSAGHRGNILTGEFTQTGVGVWKVKDTYYFTQVFIRPL